MRILHLDRHVGRNEACHYAMASLDQTGPLQEHTHRDFQELFWVKSGRGAHLINGVTRPLAPRMLVFVRREDRHGLMARADSSLTIVNVAFAEETWAVLRERYFTDRSDPFGKGPAADREHHLGRHTFRLLEQAAKGLADGRRSQLAIDRFLMDAVDLLAAHLPQRDGVDLPGWLQRACTLIHQPAHFRRGTRALAELAGRSPEHTARELRRLTGRTPTQIVNYARLRHAAARLAATDEPILTIAMDCGLPNLAHFYQLFRAAYGTTPRRYRLRQQQTVRPA